MSNARRIEDFIQQSPQQREDSPKEEARLPPPKFVGHLLVLPLTSGEEASVDPEEITAISRHRKEPDVTVLRQRGDSFTYFVDRPYEVVMNWLGDAFRD